MRGVRPGSGAGPEADRALEGQLAAAEVRGEIEVVDAEVHEDAARARPGRTDPPQVDRQDCLAPDELRQRAHDRVEPLGVPDEEARPRSDGGARRAGLTGRRTHRLLDEDVPPCSEAARDDRRVRVDGRGDDDDLTPAERLGFAAEPEGALGRRGRMPGVERADDFEAALQGPEHSRMALPHRAQADEGHLVTSRRPSAHSIPSVATYMPRPAPPRRAQKRSPRAWGCPYASPAERGGGPRGWSEEKGPKRMTGARRPSQWGGVFLSAARAACLRCGESRGIDR